VEQTTFQARLKFWLLDEGRFSAEYLAGLQRLMAAIFRMEHTRDLEDTKRAIRYLGRAVAQSPFKQTIDRVVMQRMRYRLSRKMPGVPLPTRDELLRGTEMLETNMDQWKAKAVAEGVLIGEQRGLQMGKLEGESLALQRLLVRRFGSIPPAKLEQIASANLEQIETWFDAAINAPHLAAVFTPTSN
jgi:hypothetical protein